MTQVREAGLPVEFGIDGEPRELPVGIELSAYRIVQEALTNALKHAGRAHAAVRVRYGARLPRLKISDDGAGIPADVPGGGHGLAGIVSGSPCTGVSSTRPPAGTAVSRSGCCCPMTTVLIADDQALVRVGLRKILESEPQTTVTGEASDGQDAVAAARRLRPDVVLMDIRMPVLTASKPPGGSCGLSPPPGC